MGRGKRIEGMLNELPEPSSSELVVIVTGTPGGNIVQVADAQGQSFLCRIPTKFRGAVWVKKGGYLIVERGEQQQQHEGAGASDGPNESTEHSTLAHFLYRDQIRHLQSRGLWPFGESDDLPPSAENGSKDYGGQLCANTNRAHQVPDSDSSEDESDEDESDDDDDDE